MKYKCLCNFTTKNSSMRTKSEWWIMQLSFPIEKTKQNKNKQTKETENEYFHNHQVKSTLKFKQSLSSPRLLFYSHLNLLYSFMMIHQHTLNEGSKKITCRGLNPRPLFSRLFLFLFALCLAMVKHTVNLKYFE